MHAYMVENLKEQTCTCLSQSLGILHTFWWKMLFHYHTYFGLADVRFARGSLYMLHIHA